MIRHFQIGGSSQSLDPPNKLPSHRTGDFAILPCQRIDILVDAFFVSSKALPIASIMNRKESIAPAYLLQSRDCR